MRLNGRVSKREKKTGGSSRVVHPSVIFINSVSQKHDGELMSEPGAAHVRTPTGWDHVQREEGESGEDLENRVDRIAID